MTLLAPALRFERPGAGSDAAGSSGRALGFTRAPVWCGFDAVIAGGILLWCLGFAWLRLALSPAIGVDDAEIDRQHARVLRFDPHHRSLLRQQQRGASVRARHPVGDLAKDGLQLGLG